MCLPDTIETIESHAFSGCDSLNDVYYVGTKEQWGKINISFYSRIVTEFGSECNDAFRGVRVHCGMDGPDTWVQYSGYSEIELWISDPDEPDEPSSALTYVYAKEPATAWSAAYDGNGKCLEIKSHALTAGEINQLSFDIPAETQSVKVFVLGVNSGPLCSCARETIKNE